MRPAKIPLTSNCMMMKTEEEEERGEIEGQHTDHDQAGSNSPNLVGIIPSDFGPCTYHVYSVFKSFEDTAA